MRLLIRYFFRGLLVFVPAVLTIAIVVLVFRTVDAWMGLPIPGAGFLATVTLIVVVGALASNFVTKRLFELVEGVFRRLPFVKLLYSAIRDVTDAFVGERKGFDRPVVVTLDEATGLKAVGFLTRDSLDDAGLPGRKTASLQQGMLQIVRDFCAHSNALCQNCRFPGLVERLKSGPTGAPAVPPADQ